MTQLDTTTGIQLGYTATGVRVNCLYHIFSQKWNARNKQTSFAFLNFGEDLSYYVIRRYKLRDLIKIYDDFENDPIKEIFRRLCHYFRLAGKVWWNINGFSCIQHVKAC